MTRFRSYSSKISSNLKKNPALAIGTGAAFTGFTYLLFAQKPEPKVIKERKLPPVAQLIPFPIVEKIIHQNEYSIKEAPGIHRMDINSVASNDPGEDYHSEHSVNKASIVGIFDGHGGPECGALVAKYIGTYVNRYVNSPQLGKISKKHHIMAALEKAFIQLDYDIIHGCLPDFNHQNSWNPLKISHDYMTIVKALKSAKSGSCALVAYVEGKDVYIASIGDCRAVLGRKYGDSFKSIDLTEDQTGRTPSEFSRLCEEHPGEDATVIVRGRVLGGLMPTRSFGDARYKWPVSLQTTFIPHIYTNKVVGIPPNYLSPPYVTAKPEITHYELDDNDRFLILACDGLWDDMSSEKSVEIISKLVGENYTNNYATALIQAALSGAEHGGPLVDNEKIQHHLSIQPPLCRRYRDDMTVNVIFFKEFSGVEAKGKILDKPAEYIPATLSQLDKWVTYLNDRFIAKL